MNVGRRYTLEVASSAKGALLLTYSIVVTGRDYSPNLTMRSYLMHLIIPVSSKAYQTFALLIQLQEKSYHWGETFCLTFKLILRVVPIYSRPSALPTVFVGHRTGLYLHILLQLQTIKTPTCHNNFNDEIIQFAFPVFLIRQF